MTTPKYLASNKKVPAFGDPKSPLWIIGEAPGAQEVLKGRPFIGPSGDKLTAVLESYGISNYYLTNLCPLRPVGNNFSLLIREGKTVTMVDELKNSLYELYKDILTFKPKAILALGYYPLTLLTNKKGAISSHRGSVYEFLYESTIKVIPTFHPSFVLRDPSNYPAFDCDIERLSRVLKDEYKHPTYNITLNPTQEVIEQYAKEPYLAVDIETVKFKPTIICISFAKSRSEAISIHLDGSARARYQVAQLLACDAHKIFHNGVFDVSVLEYNNYDVKNYTEDTIVASHVLYLEMPKDLEFLTSIYTDMPYYKDEGKRTIPSDSKGWTSKRQERDLPSLMSYNCKDTMATFWIWEELTELLDEDEDNKRIYRYEMDLTLELIKLGHTGMLRDPVRLEIVKSAVEAEREKYENILTMCIGVKFNAASPKQVKDILYKAYGLPPQTKLDPKTKKRIPTADNDALVKLLSLCRDDKYQTPIIQIATVFIDNLIRFRGVDKMLSSQINVTPSLDGRIKSLYRAHGTESGRIAANKYIDGTGMNSQTITRDSVEIAE